MIGEGKTRGQSAILDVEACTNQNVAGLVFDSQEVYPEFIWYWAQAKYTQTRRSGRGGEQPALNGLIVRDMMIHLPPLHEQHELVRRVEALFALADRIEGEVAGARERVDALTQAALAKAFRGELVPTEVELARREGREYEPAAVLLERVRAGREDGHTKEIPTRNRRSSRQSSLPVENCD